MVVHCLGRKLFQKTLHCIENWLIWPPKKLEQRYLVWYYIISYSFQFLVINSYRPCFWNEDWKDNRKYFCFWFCVELGNLAKFHHLNTEMLLAFMCKTYISETEIWKANIRIDTLAVLLWLSYHYPDFHQSTFSQFNLYSFKRGWVFSWKMKLCGREQTGATNQASTSIILKK